MAKKVSIIILDFLKSKRVVKNVDFIRSQVTDFEVEIIIVDNSCNKENRRKLEGLREFENVKLIFNEKNLGYTKANNVAAEKASGDFLLIVNPDILIKEEGSLQRLIDYMEENPEIGILGTKQIDDDGSVTMNVRAFPRFFLQVARRTFFRHIPGIKQAVEYDEMRHLDYGKVQDVDWLQSSFVVVRMDLWRELEGFNEDYFLFMGDPDICWRSWEREKRVVYYPEVKVYADGIRVSSGGFAAFFKKWTIRQHVIDSLKYRMKYLGKRNPRKKLNY